MTFHAVLALATIGLAAVLGAVSALAATRTRSPRFWFAALAFWVMGGKALVYVLGQEGVVDVLLVPASHASLAFDAAVLGLLYMAIVKE